MEEPGKSPSGVKQTIAVPGESFSCGPAGRKVRELDINEPPADKDEEEKEEEDEEEILMGGADDSEDGENGNPRPKRLRLSEEQTQLLEDTFRKNCVLSHSAKEELAPKVKLTPRQVEVWFQNRRARIKLRRAKNECKLLKQRFKLLMEENQRLQQEVKELHALLVAARTTTIIMCPRCKRVTSVAGIQRCSKTPDTNLSL
uniref:Homeobox-leucine zipper protein HOX3 isoform X2 n=1 Tax=Elaeis guineensis var. tenera TaxID=51953 RepID=A0A6I9S2U0_ELAGV|nr:homeobox-leucine zipper protein HOX3 isoform X2 [Elaeis guineensis]